MKKQFGFESYVNHPSYGIGKCIGNGGNNGAYWKIEFEGGEVIDFVREKIEKSAVYMISFKAAAGMGIDEVTEYFWDGTRFTTEYKTVFATEIDDELTRAQEHIKNNRAAVAMYPDKYEFGIK